MRDATLEQRMVPSLSFDTPVAGFNCLKEPEDLSAEQIKAGGKVTKKQLIGQGAAFEYCVKMVNKFHRRKHAHKPGV